MNETIKTLVSRRSVRSYKDTPVPDDILNEILTAGEYAPNGRGKQSAVMVVVKDKKTINMLSQINARIMDGVNDPFYGAPTLVIVFADSTINTYIEDGSLVMGNLMNAAFSLGVDSCWIHRAKETFQTDEGKALMKKWGLDEKYVGIGNCILGYADSVHAQPAARKDGFVIFD